MRNVYSYLVYKSGEPEKFGRGLALEKAAVLEEFSGRIDKYEDMKIAAISDTDGSYAIPMALMGGSVTVFGVSEDGRRYASEAAAAAGAQINYEVCEILETEERFFGEFDAVIIKNAVIHYFYDIEAFFKIVRSMLKTGGKLICMDFHPFYKNGAHCAGSRFSIVQRQLPETSEKRFALIDILRAVSVCGFNITDFTEETVTEGMTSRSLAILEAEKW